MGNEFKEIEYTNKYFKKNIEYLLKKTGLTKKEIETQLNRVNGILTRYCREDNKAPKPGIDILLSLANGFGITIDELINNDIEKNYAVVEDKDKDRKEIVFLRKIIDDTKSNLIDWRYYKLNGNDSFYEEMFEYNLDEEKDIFKSKYLVKEEAMEEGDIIYASINSNTSDIYIVRCFDEKINMNFYYEVYLKTSSGVIIKGGASYTQNWEGIKEDVALDKVLNEVYKEAEEYITAGKERFMREDIFDKYINNYNDDMPF